ncbi:hypothetical protein MVEN_02444500 [Mycena venus]|uniref:F-box domain-containing protein n=1 Tax=Mycena venus TaxID=2733690 RepID=A0A8H6WYR8_9AGAR|nr:hypothetical protein MVEN_02444500 [Mycena venus]
MACSQALQITEIVRLISEEADTESWYIPPITLVSLATTSRIFSDPALDLIWREQRSLVPLVKCMPDTLWEEREGVVIHLLRPIASSDMSRLLFYSVRVRDLSMDDPIGRGKRGTLHPEFLRALDLSLPPHLFMPKLSHFSWVPKKKEVLSIMRHFLGARIRKIDLGFGEHSMNLSILPFIKYSCPLISEFDLRVQTDPYSTPLISDAVCGWQHLTDLSIPNLDEAGFMHIARLPSLSGLNLRSAKDTMLPYPPEFLTGSSFPALKYLFLGCETVRFCAGLVQVISSPNFESLSIRPLTSWTTVAWGELHTTLRDCFNNSAFQTIEVDGEEDESSHPVDITPYALSSDALRPLLEIKTLTSVSYQIYPGLDVDDEFLEEMALAWPDLQSLHFSTEVFQTQQPRATLKCLIAFAQHCLELSALGLCMDATDVPEFTQVPGDRVSNWLNSLEVGASPINATKEAHIAAFISNLFPQLEYLIPFSSVLVPEAFSSHAKSWRRVEDMIPVFASVRLQEKVFWTQDVDGLDEETGGSTTVDDAEELA